jgi:opacity protein-like surface antigen
MMKKIIFASACILALASPAAFAQKAQPTDGASSQGNVGPGASQGAMKDNNGAMRQGTVGASRPSAAGDASTSGASTAAGVNNTGSATEPGAVKSGVNKQ